MANDANTFKVGSATAQNVTPKIYENEIISILSENNFFRSPMMAGIVETKNVIGQAGDLIYIPKAVKLGKANAYDDGDTIAITPVSFGQINLTTGITGIAIRITNKQMRDQLTVAKTDLLSQLAYNMAELESKSIFTALNATTSPILYANDRADSDAIVVGDVFNTDLISDAITAARLANVDLTKKVVIVNPKSEGDMRKNADQFIDASKLGSDRVIASGHIGSFYGVDILVSTYVESTDNESSVPVYENLFLAKDSLYIIDKKRPQFQMDEELKRDMAMTFMIDADTGYAIKRDESVQVLRSA